MAAIKRVASVWLLLLLSACVTTGTSPGAMSSGSVDGVAANTGVVREAKSVQVEPSPLDEEQRQGLDTVLEVMRAGEWSTARAMMQELLISYPMLAVAYANLGNIQLQLGDSGKAEQAWLKALELRPGWAAVCNQLGIFYRQQGKFDQALAMYQQALTSDEGYVMTHRNIAILYELYLGDGVKALEHYHRYRELVGGDEREVLLWIADLERRVKGGGQ
jgi:Flp pilus assembly protein TadD